MDVKGASYSKWPFHYQSKELTCLHNQKTKAPVLIIHARDDHDIPASHSARLFELLSNSRSRAGNVESPKITHREGWGSIALHTGDQQEGGQSQAVVYFEADHGAHNRVGGGEGVVELMRAFLNSETVQAMEYSVTGGIR